MKYCEILFSPTGGTKAVADTLTRKLAAEYTTIDLCNRNTDFGSIVFDKEDICVVAVPSYGGRVPAVAIERIRQLHGNGAKAVLTVVYGNREYEDTLVELKDALDAAGFVGVAAVTAIAEHSIVRSIAPGRPDPADRKELERFAETIRARLQTGEVPALSVPGNRPYKGFKGLPMHPSADKRCVKCGICAESCPVGAIPMDDPSKTDKEACIACMRCIAVCPKQARSVNSLVLAGAAQMLKKACSGHKENKLF